MRTTVRSLVIGSFVVGAASMLLGCSAIRVVHASKAGGEIALIGDREQAMEKARLEMANTCGGPQTYDIVEEGETVIGTHTTESQQTEAGHSWTGAPATRTTGSQDTVQKTEWRVKYACKGVAQPAPAGAPAPAPAPAPTPQARVIHEVVVVY